MTYVDGWHGAVEWHMYEIKRALESERPTGQLARLFRTRHAYLYLPGLSRINDTSSFTWVAANEE